MGTYHIKGGRKLSGEMEASGAKNAALPILAASVITTGENVFEACPEISDVDSMITILRSLGCEVVRDGAQLAVNASGLSESRISEELMKEMRSSVFLAGSLLARCGEAVISSPGGCNIGRRPIDIHIKGLRQLGADIRQSPDNPDHIVIKAGKLKGTQLKLDYPSVGATENLMLAAISAEGTTIIENSAREPEIVALQDYINKCGGNVAGAGSGIITIKGGTKLHGCSHRVIADRIEAGTFMLMSLGTGGEIYIKGITAEYLKPLINCLKEGGCRIREEKNSVYASAGADTIKISGCISTAPYPGFPTDLQPQLTAFLTKHGVKCMVEENIFENRFRYAKQLIKMGADIEISKKQVIIKGNNILYGGDVEAEDLRGGAALVIAGLMAEGDTAVRNTKYIKRGYSRFAGKIRALGGEISENDEREQNSKECQKKETT